MKYINKKNYDDTYSIKDKDIQIYSQDKISDLYPNGDYDVVGEIRKRNIHKKIDTIVLANEEVKVTKYKKHNKIFYKIKGYICVGKDKYISIVQSRILFLIILFGLGICSAGALAGGIYFIAKTPTLSPDYPLPEVDENTIKVDNTKSTTAENGSGNVSINYSLDARLSGDKISLYLLNPGKSNKDFVITVYVKSGNKDIAIARSGLVKSGSEINAVNITEKYANLSSGIYNAYYLLDFYDPETGEKALTNTKIDKVKLTVS